VPTYSAESLIAQARAETGLERFGDESFLAPLRVTVENMVGEANLTEESLAMQCKELVRALSVRLRAQSYAEQHPEIRQETVTPAMVIVGPQRSGTSKLFRVVAADPQWTKLYTWQAMNPIPLDGLTRDGPDPRIAIAEGLVERMRWLQPAHEMDARAPEMEAMLLSMAFMTNSPTRLMPTHQRYCETADHRPAYRFLHEMLQFIQWQNAQPRRPWVLKSPSHLQSLDALTGQYPAATLVMTHRHPSKNVGSMLKLAELGTRSNARSYDPAKVREVWYRVLVGNMQKFLAYRDAHGDDRWVDISYRTVHADAAGAVKRIYDSVGAPFTEANVQIIARWEKDNPQHKKGEFSYDLADYGLTEADIERDFAEYIARYGHLF
jgi:hypothetical protein